MMMKIAYRNLFRNRRRTLATGTAIVAGFVGLTLLGGYIIRVQNSLKVSTIYLNHRGHLSVYKKEGLDRFSVKPSKFQINSEEKTRIYEILKHHETEIEYIGEALSGTGLISNGQKSVPFVATGFDPELEEKLHAHPLVKAWAKDYLNSATGSFTAEVRKDPLTISITKRLGELIGRDVPFSNLSEDQRSVQLAARTFQNDLNAVNAQLRVSHTSGSSMAEDTSLWAPIKMLQDLYATDGIHFLALYLKDESFAPGLKTSIDQEFRQAGLDLETYFYDNEKISPIYVGSMGFLHAMAGFFIFLICGAVALSIVNSLTMGILERTKELGTLRAIGFKAKDICFLFAEEAFILTLISIGVGCALAIAISSYVNAINIRFSPPGVSSDVQFLLTPNLTWLGVVAGILIFVSVTTGYVASTLKLKAKVIDLLSDSGA